MKQEIQNAKIIRETLDYFERGCQGGLAVWRRFLGWGRQERRIRTGSPPSFPAKAGIKSGDDGKGMDSPSARGMTVCGGVYGGRSFAWRLKDGGTCECGGCAVCSLRCASFTVIGKRPGG